MTEPSNLSSFNMFINNKGEKFYISTTCLQTNPCIHSVVLPNGEEKSWRGYKIALYLEENGYNVNDHFNHYLQNRSYYSQFI